MKKIFSFLILVIVLSVASLNSPSEAFAESSVETNVDAVTPLKTYGPYNFKTRDGQWDGKLTVPQGGANVTVTVRNLNFSGDPMVRLCNANTGNCTGFGPLRQPNLTRTFTGMLPGSYYGDVVTGTVAASGTITFDVR
ncbi:hypothetical protein [Shouchella patagoniensis]|uniref:hypothetical protein n=1 Tax=Shouchella patagoniensis TaxID=228576 RepID=UPI000994B1A4|nr:hypothetical protein [Shouchella patagoniensis]